MSILFFGALILTLIPIILLTPVVIPWKILEAFCKRVLDCIYHNREDASLALMRGITIWATVIIVPMILSISIIGFKAWAMLMSSKIAYMFVAGPAAITLGGFVKYLSVTLPRFTQGLFRIRFLILFTVTWLSGFIAKFLPKRLTWINIVRLKTFIFGDLVLAIMFQLQKPYPATSAG